MYSWGSSNIAKYFSRERNDTPTDLKCFQRTSIKVARINQALAVVLLEDGSVHSFGGENDILGHAKNGSKVTALETLSVSDVSVGGGHIFAISNNGKVFGWGQNGNGQLGWKENNSYNIPKLVKPLQSHKISMVACGQTHSLFLGYNGTIWSAGNNEFGQVGLGNDNLSSSELKQITSLQAIPFAQVAAGHWHSFGVTVSGTVFGWGRNDHGQLGIGDTNNRSSPTLLKSLRTQTVNFISAGEFHTAALTADGGIFTFGSNAYGQLGHGYSHTDGSSTQNIVTVPRKVFELMGYTVTQLACGCSHTITYVAQSKQIYVFGDKQHGQLGYISKIKNEEFLPHTVPGPWQVADKAQSHQSGRKSGSGGTSFSKMDHSGLCMYGPNVYVREICAGGNESLVLSSSNNVEPLDFRQVLEHKRIFSVNNVFISKLQSLPAETKIAPDVGKYLETVMKSSSCLNASFLASDHHRTSGHYPGVSLMSARLAFSKIDKCPCKEVNTFMAHHLHSTLIPNLTQSPPDIEALRLYLFLPECLLFSIPEFYTLITFPFAHKCTSLAREASKVLDNWYATLEPGYFLRQVGIYKETIMHILSRPIAITPDELKRHLRAALNFLYKLNQVNNSVENFLIPYQKFYLHDISRLINLEEDYVRWMQGNSDTVMFCNYPFLLNSIAKTSLLQIDATWQMRAAYIQARERNMASMWDHTSMEMPVLELEVRRLELVHDALSKLATVDTRSLKKPFIVIFEGEDGQDAGGVRKEFFMLILKEVIDPKYGMFRYFEDSRLIWFSDWELETDMMYSLVGILCGLAIYNNTIIDICFPLALYKKLLGESITLSDLKELDPTVCNSMQQLLDYHDFDRGSVEDVFCLNFTISTDNFGETRTIELISGGTGIAVTQENRKEFVHLYLDYVFNKSVRHQFEAFSEGFHKVCGGRILKLFRPAELMEMVVGNQNYNWEEFEKQADYKGEYYRNHKTIDHFWDVFHSLTLEEKKDFLLFLTGCNKVPISGVKITIQPVKTSENHLPVAHTCFNLLDLPLYTNRETLRRKLKQAMLNNQGFHLV